MNASEVYEKYKHMDELFTNCKGNPSTQTALSIICNLWSAVKHEHFGQVVVNDVSINGKSIMKEGE